MSTDSLTLEHNHQSLGFPFNSEVANTKLVEGQTDDYVYVARQLLTDPSTTLHNSSTADHWTPPKQDRLDYAEASRTIIINEQGNTAEIKLRLGGGVVAGKDFWDKTIAQIPFAQNFRLTVDCANPSDPRPDEIIYTGSDAETALGGLTYLVELEERFKAQGVPEDQINAIFDITSPPSNTKGWYKYAQKLEPGHNYLLPPAIKKLLVDRGLFIDHTHYDPIQKRHVHPTIFPVRVSAFIEHTPKGARVTVVDNNRNKFYVFSENHNGVYLLKGEIDNDGKQYGEQIKKYPDKKNNTLALFQWLPSEQSSICTEAGKKQRLLFARQPAVALVDRRSGKTLSHRVTGHPVLEPLFEDDTTVALPPYDSSSETKVAVSTIPDYSPACHRYDDKDKPHGESQYTLIKGHLPNNVGVLVGNISRLALEHELLDRAIRGKKITSSDFENTLQRIHSLIQLHENVDDATKPNKPLSTVQQYNIYRKLIKEMLNNL